MSNQSIIKIPIAAAGVQSVTGLNTDNSDPANPIVKISVDGISITGLGTPGSPLVSHDSGVQSVTGLNTDNTDPQNPVVQISVDGSTITGDGTPGSPLVAVNNGTVESVTGLNTDNTDPANPIVQISVDGVTITGDGTPGDPLVASGGGGGGIPYSTVSTLMDNTVYQASADGGFVVAYGNGNFNRIYVYSDSSNPPTTLRGSSLSTSSSAGDGATVSVPILPNAYFKTVGANVSVFFYEP